jgi:hypothetical protein
MSSPDASQGLSERTVSWLGRVTTDRRSPMGVEYQHFLIPEDNTYKPGPEDLSRLVDALLAGGFVSRAGAEGFRRMTFHTYTHYQQVKKTGCYAHVGGQGYAPFPCPCSSEDVAALSWRDFRLVWPVESSNESGLKYPLAPFPEWGDAYYDLELRVAREFVYHCSEVIDPFDAVACDCGQPLEFFDRDEDFERPSVFHDVRIFRTCPSCGRPFRPQRLTARVRDGYTGEAIQRAGGATYLFTVVIDCGKGFARDGWPIRATEEFLGMVTQALDQEFYEIGDVY